MSTTSFMSITIRSLSIGELENKLDEVAALLKASVDAGAGLGFLPPLAPAEAKVYWLSLRSELRAGSRLLLAACAADRVVGTGQLAFAQHSNAPHRAELQKLFVDGALRGRGVGRLLVSALHDAARQRGRSLLVLSTRHGLPPERFYRGLGYREAGLIPGFSRGPAGERYDSLTLYQELSS